MPGNEKALAEAVRWLLPYATAQINREPNLYPAVVGGLASCKDALDAYDSGPAAPAPLDPDWEKLVCAALNTLWEVEVQPTMTVIATPPWRDLLKAIRDLLRKRNGLYPRGTLSSAE